MPRFIPFQGEKSARNRGFAIGSRANFTAVCACALSSPPTKKAAPSAAPRTIFELIPLLLWFSGEKLPPLYSFPNLAIIVPEQGGRMLPVKQTGYASQYLNSRANRARLHQRCSIAPHFPHHAFVLIAPGELFRGFARSGHPTRRIPGCARIIHWRGKP